MINLEGPDDQIPDPPVYIRQLTERIEKVLALHWEKTISGVPVGECATCGRLWPCETVKILTGETP